MNREFGLWPDFFAYDHYWTINLFNGCAEIKEWLVQSPRFVRVHRLQLSSYDGSAHHTQVWKHAFQRAVRKSFGAVANLKQFDGIGQRGGVDTG
jgi:hypothetical protein